MISVIVPAYNEASVIELCLRSMLAGARLGDLEIIVVCNGCKDRTADLARSFGDPVRVIEAALPSKANALNLGDQAASAFPRFYVDADIIISFEALQRVAEVLRGGQKLAGAPRMRVRTKGRNWLIRAYYEVWGRLPYVTEGMIGSGVYAVSEMGRRRFTSFPNITADDGYVQMLFQPHERAVVEDCYFEVTPPTSIIDLIKIKTRVHFGKYELFARYPELRSNAARMNRNGLSTLWRQPALWPCMVVFACIQYAAKLRACFRFCRRRRLNWDRDESSRRVFRA